MYHLTTRTIRLIVSGVAIASASIVAPAQTAPALSPDRVTFYTEPNFQGESLVVEAGAAVENLESMLRSNQQPWAMAISSVHVDGTARATIYSAAGFGGDRLEITRSIPDLYGEPRGRIAGANWDRAIVSLAVTSPQRATAMTPLPPIAGERPTTVVVMPPPPPPPPHVIVVQPPRPRLDRRTADLIVQRAFREVLDRPPDPEGLRRYRERLMVEGWSERQVIEQLQRSAEARAVNPDAAIAKAFREVLGREPDPNGLAHYKAKWREGWTQGQIREDLRRSKEGREGNIRAAIVRAYREVLGREPDPEGYATYERAMRERGYTERDVRAALMSGDEYRQKRGRK